MIHSLKAFLLSLLLHTSVVDLIIVRRQFHDGILYEDYASESDNVRYSVTGGAGWDNLDSLAASNNLEDKAMFCTRGPGAWFLYPDVSFGLGTSHQLKLLYGEYCVPVDNINSILPIGGVYSSIVDMNIVVSFTEKYFQSAATSIKDGGQLGKSAVFLGNAKWTVDDGSGKAICVTALALDGDVCLVENLATAFPGSSGQVSIKKGCENDDMEEYNLQSCYSIGYHVIAYEIDLNVESMTKMCNSSGFDVKDNAKNKFLNVLKIWQYRMLPDYARKIGDRWWVTPEIMLDIPHTRERYRVLVTMTQIMQSSCPALHPLFLEIVSEIYFSIHAKHGEIWNNVQSENVTGWEEAEKFALTCLDNVNSSHAHQFQISCQPDEPSAFTRETQVETIEDFLNGASYDFVIEQVWLMLNYITAYCTSIFNYNDNYWTEFPILAKKEYLYPVKEQWLNPGVWASFYPQMFNGIDLQQERKDMISCLQAMIIRSPSYDPLARPPGFLKTISPSLKESIGKGTTQIDAKQNATKGNSTKEDNNTRQGEVLEKKAANKEGNVEAKKEEKKVENPEEKKAENPEEKKAENPEEKKVENQEEKKVENQEKVNDENKLAKIDEKKDNEGNVTRRKRQRLEADSEEMDEIAQNIPIPSKFESFSRLKHNPVISGKTSATAGFDVLKKLEAGVEGGKIRRRRKFRKGSRNGTKKGGGHSKARTQPANQAHPHFGGEPT